MNKFSRVELSRGARKRRSPHVGRQHGFVAGQLIKGEPCLQSLLNPGSQRVVPLAHQRGDLASCSCSRRPARAVEVVHRVQGEVEVYHVIHPPGDVQPPAQGNLPFSSCNAPTVSENPVFLAGQQGRPASAVRPVRWRYSTGFRGKSKCIT
jgi:hypothetical protein